MALKQSSKRKTSFRKNKSFRWSNSVLSLAQSPKPRSNASLIPSLKANNKQLALAFDKAKRKVRRSEERLLKLQQENQELLERNAKSERCIQSLQVTLPKAEQLLQEADAKISEAKKSIVQAKETAMEHSITEISRGSIFNISSDSFGATVAVEQLSKFEPVLASTPRNSPSARKDVDIACSMFDDAFKDELSISSTETLGSPLPDKFDTGIEEKLPDENRVTKDVTSLPTKALRPKRLCRELATSYAEGDLARRISGEDVEKRNTTMVRKQKNKSFKKKPMTALRNITNIV